MRREGADLEVLAFRLEGPATGDPGGRGKFRKSGEGAGEGYRGGEPESDDGARVPPRLEGECEEATRDSVT